MKQIKTFKFPLDKTPYELVDDNLRTQINKINSGDSGIATVDWVNSKLSMLSYAHRHSYGEPYLSNEFSTGYGQKCIGCGWPVELIPTTLSSLSVGDSVFMNVGGTRTEFLVVHQGLPSGSWYGTLNDENTYSYDSSCNGTWLLMKDVYPVEVKYYDSNQYLTYMTSTIHEYLANTFFYLLDSNIQTIVKQVKLPVQYGNTLDAKVFLLSAYELGVYEDESSIGDPLPPMSGRKLDYFIQDMYLHNQNAAAYEQRKCYNNGNSAAYPTRTTWDYYSEEDDFTYYEYWYVTESGAISRRYTNYGTAYMETPRPALILPSEALVDENNNILA